MDSETVVGLDLGSHKVCLLVGEVTPDEMVRIIGTGVCPARGIRRGVVVNVDEVASCVATAVERAERVSGYDISSALVSINGNHVSSVNSRGVVAVSRPDHEITAEDVERVIEAARAVAMPSNREVLQVIPRFFIVDGQEGVPDPIGMFGFRLEVEAHIVTAATTALQNVQRALAKANIELRGMLPAPLAAAEAVLTPEERDMGVVLADIGGGTTGVCLFTEGAPYHTTVLQVGGMNITNDLTVGLRIPFNAAEDLKTRYGHALASAVSADETIDVTGASREVKTVSRQQACEIIEERAAEICALILNEIKKSGYEGRLPGGVVLTGGTAELPGLVDLAREVIGLPVRVGVPQDVGGLVDNILSPAYAVSVGLLQWSKGHQQRGSGRPGHQVTDGVAEMGRKIVRWFQDAFGFRKV